MVNRILEEVLKNRFFGGKAIILIGPRQVGKTTLIKKIMAFYEPDTLLLDGDDPTVLRLLERPNTEQLKQLIGRNKIVFIDEAQRIPEIGLTAKIIIDQIKATQLIISGSSAFEINQLMQEPLTGRKWTYHLFPISWKEYEQHYGMLKAEQNLENRLVFGFYPEIISSETGNAEALIELTESYLYKDILAFYSLKRPDILQKLLEALAFQVGNEVAYKELGDLVGADAKTVSSYIDILEKAYVVFRLQSFSRNLRDEIKTNRKVYFYDNGVRNAVIRQFQPLSVRQDVGALWENFLISDRMKQISYARSYAKSYFWRTKQQQEVDYVEEMDGQVRGFEFKWNEKRNIRFPSTFTDHYKSINQGITRQNFREFVM